MSSVAISLFPAREHKFEASAKIAKELGLYSIGCPSACGIDNN